MQPEYHIHTTYCDGKNTPEEIVLAAIDNGMHSIGFSAHGHTPFDFRYCMKNTAGYIEEVSRLKKKYKEKIQIYCGAEEDAFSYIDRKSFDYIIGSFHYFNIGEKYYSIDFCHDDFKECLEAFEFDVIKLTEAYYSSFVSYIVRRKPDIVGHFDLITKFDEIDVQRFLNNSDYIKIAEKYMQIASESDLVFEVNTGAIARGLRKTPYPAENLLYILKKNRRRLMLASDCHNLDNLNYYFDESKAILRDIGFDCVYEFDGGEFKKRLI